MRALKINNSTADQVTRVSRHRASIGGQQWRLALLSGLLLISTAAVAAGNAEAGKAKTATCSACHGTDGNSVNAEWPSLAGQHEDYLVDAMQSFKNGSRSMVLMTGQIDNLSDQDIEDIAAFFASQNIARKTADPELVAQGERLYRGGDLDRGISACLACHGPSGHGNPLAGYPSLSNQHAKYTANQLMAYRDQTRQTDAGVNQIMRNISALMTEEDILAVAAYVQGLQ
jgi:cytochrome c553